MDIKNCPFCNGSAVVSRGQHGDVFRVVCEECGSQGRTCFVSEADAIETWNRRAPITIMGIDPGAPEGSKTVVVELGKGVGTYSLEDDIINVEGDVVSRLGVDQSQFNSVKKDLLYWAKMYWHHLKSGGGVILKSKKDFVNIDSGIDARKK